MKASALIASFFFSLCAVITSSAQTFTSTSALVYRQIPWLAPHVKFNHIPAAGKTSADEFRLSTKNNTLFISATSSSAAAMAVNWYLKYYCHQSLSFQTKNIFPLKKLPLINGTVKVSTPFAKRYSLNYCTISYTMPYYHWQQWEYVLDWLALNGVNIALAPVGTEEVWANTLTDFHFTKSEIAQFIPHSTFLAWWLMGNLEGWGGPVNHNMIVKQTLLQKKILARMQQLDIQPVVQGFYGMVPTALKSKFPQAVIINQGHWAGGFARPSILNPTDSLFTAMAKSFYDNLKKLYGYDFKYFSGDPFHEGGVIQNVDLPLAGAKIYSAMSTAFPAAVWVLQGWGNNPTPALLANVPVDKALVIDLMGEDHKNWERNPVYTKFPWILGSVNNFGDNNGNTGKLSYLKNLPLNVYNSPYGKTLVGIGQLPEGYANNPVLYDLIFESAWHHKSLDLHTWLKNYIQHRYGSYNQSIEDAWKIFAETIYSSNIPANQGAPQSVFCARPSLTSPEARLWGTIKRAYDTEAYKEGVKLFKKAAPLFLDNENYKYDMVDFERQVYSNLSVDLFNKINEAYKHKNIHEFDNYTGQFLHAMQQCDSLLGGNKHFSLSTWLKQAATFGSTKSARQQSIRNAKMQITYWGADNPESNLHDYANKEWGGLMQELYIPRWQAYFIYLRQKLQGKTPAMPDFFAMEKAWVHKPVRLQ